MAQTKQEEILLKVEKLLPKTRGRFSPEDLAAETGYSLFEINDSVKRLLEIYRAKVTMNPENGKLLFQFIYPLEKIGKKSFAEVMQNFLNVLWKVFQAIYKALTGIILIVYTVVFVIIIIALSMSGGNDRDRRGPDLSIFGGLFRAIFEGMYWISFSNRIQMMTDPSGLRYKQYEKPKNKGKNFVQAVFHFVFGPEVPPKDELGDKRETLAYLRKVSNGRLTAADIVLLSGVTMNKAEELLAEYAAKFSGELEIDDDGNVIADFTNMLHSQSQDLDGGQIIYYYDEVEQPAVMNGNSTGRNAGIILMNTFNLIVSIFLLNTLGDPILYKEQIINVPVFFQIALGWFPMIFSISFFLIPILRYPFVLRAKKLRENNIMRKKLLYAIVVLRNDITFEKIANTISLPQNLFSKAQNSLNKLMAEMRGTVDINENAVPIYNVDNFILNLNK